MGRQTLITANNNGYGLQVTGATTLSGTPTFTVTNATNSNLLMGLHLSGQVTGEASILKNGGGTLLLSDNTNSFGGPVSFDAFGAGATLTVANTDFDKLVVGQRLSGTNINAGTSISSINVQNFASRAASGSTVVILGTVGLTGVVTAGMPVSGTGVQAGTTIVSAFDISNTTTGSTLSTANFVYDVQGGTSDFRVGMEVSGNGIPGGTYVAEIMPDGTTLRLSQDITANNPTLVRKQVTLSQPVTSDDPVLVLTKLGLNQNVAGAISTVNANSMVNVSAGVLAFTNDGALGDSTNEILVNTNSATVGLRADGTFSTSRTFIMNQQNNSFEVTAGNTLTMNSAFSFANSSLNLQKNNRGTLLLTQAQAGWNGNMTVGQGMLRISNDDALGNAGSFNFGSGVAAGATLIANVAAALELTGGISVSEALVFSPGNNNTSNGINGTGALRSVSGTNIWNGIITFSGASGADSQMRAATIGVDAGSTLTINGVMTGRIGTGGSNRGAWFGLVGAGDGTINTAMTYDGNLSFGAYSLVKAGTGTWTLTSANAFNGQNVYVNQGTLSVASTLGIPGVNGGTGTVFVTPGGSLLLDDNNGTLTNQVNSATSSNTVTLTSAAPANLIVGAALLGSTVTSISADGLTVTLAANANANLTAGTANFTFANLNNRFSNRALTLYGGVLTYNGSSTATSTETTNGALTLNPGHSIITLTAGAGQQLNFTTGAVTRNSGSTVLFRGSSLGTAAGNGIATIKATGAGYLLNIGQTGAAGTFNKGILPYAIIDSTASGLGTSFATADAVTGILRPLNSSTEMVSTLTNNLGGVATPLNVSLSTVGNVTNALTSNTMTVNSLTLNSGGGTSAQSSQTLILDSGGVLAFTGNAGISGGRLSTSSNRQFIFHALGDLTVSAAMHGVSAGLVKSGAGVMTLATQQFYSGVTVVNQGTLKLAGGTNTIFFGNDFLLQGGALDLNGTAQTLSALRFDTAAAQNANFTPGMGGTVINTSGTMATLGLVTGGSFAGMIGNGIAADSDISVVRATPAGSFGDWNIYSPNTHTGVTLLNGGRTQLLGTATFESTSAIEINQATLLISNNNATSILDQQVDNRINDAATILMRGGMLQYRARNGFEGTEAFGALTLAEGNSLIDVAEPGTGINSSTATLTRLAQDRDFVSVASSSTASNVVTLDNAAPPNLVVGAAFLGSTVTQVNGTSVTLAGNANATINSSTSQLFTTQNHGTVRFFNVDGAPGSLARVFIGSLNGVTTTNVGDGLTNHLIGGWALFERDFASYTPGTGVGALNGVGYAGYSPNSINTGTATDNIRMTYPGATSTGTVGSNLLTIASTAGLNVGDAILGAGIPADAKVASIVNGTQFTINRTLGTANPTLTLPQTVSLTGNRTINSLAMVVAGDSTLDLGGFTLNLASGGLIASQGFSTTNTQVTVVTSSTTSNVITLASVPQNFVVGSTVLGRTVTAIDGLDVTLDGNANTTGTAPTGRDYVSGLYMPIFIQNGNLTAGGTPNTAADLYLHAIGYVNGNGNVQNRDVFVSSNIVDNGSGAVTLVINGTEGRGSFAGISDFRTNELVLSGNNTYSGGTFVNSGFVVLNSAVGTAFGPGNVTITGGASTNGNGFMERTTTVVLGNSNQIGSNGTVAVASSSTAGTAVTLAAAAPSNLVVGSSFLGSTVTAVSGLNVTLAANANETIAAPTSKPFTYFGTTVSLLGGATLELNGFNQTLGGLVFNNTGGNTPTLHVGAGVLTLNGDITATSANLGSTSTISTGSMFSRVVTGSNTVTVGSTAGLAVGSLISGSGIAAGTTIAAINNGTTITLSAGATATGNNLLTFGSLGSVNLGADDRTFNVAAVTANGVNLAPLLPTLNITGIMIGSAGIIKTGNGLLQLGGPSTFTGGVDLQAGGILFGTGSTFNTGTLGGVSAGPIGTGALTMSAGTKLLSNGNYIIGNDVSTGNSLSFDSTVAGGTNLTLSGTVTLPGAVAIDVINPGMTAALGTITKQGGAGAIVITKTGLGTLALGALAAGNTVTLNLNAGNLSLLHDGNGTGEREVINTGITLVPSGAVNLTLGRLGGTYAPLFTTASNKTLQMAAFTMSGPLAITNNHGLGLELTGAATLGSNQVISVNNVPAGASASNVVQGLTFSGVVGGSSGITKQGNGTLALTGSNTFTGLVDIQGGVVAVNSDSALGNISNQVSLNVNAATGVGLRATGTFATSRTIQLNRASNAIEVTAGNTLTLNTAFGLGTVKQCVAVKKMTTARWCLPPRTRPGPARSPLAAGVVRGGQRHCFGHDGRSYDGDGYWCGVCN
jgi:autotransporter-associated beta strand protein